MARPHKSRRVCRFPQTLEFRPECDDPARDIVILTLDEYEAIRLIDHLGLSQEQCSICMQIARTTAQKIYESARKKLATALVEGLTLRIAGGTVRFCNGQSDSCSKEDCQKQELNQQYYISKGADIMRIAVTYDNGNIFQHFGHTSEFKIYNTENGRILSTQVISTNGTGHGALAEILHSLSADVLICGGIGAGAQMALSSVGIRLYGGVTGAADAAVEAFLSGSLEYNPNVKCSHHGEHHHGENCSSHGCGGAHTCGHH